jgi:hypothetical protein
MSKESELLAKVPNAGAEGIHECVETKYVLTANPFA